MKNTVKEILLEILNEAKSGKGITIKEKDDPKHPWRFMIDFSTRINGDLLQNTNISNPPVLNIVDLDTFYLKT